MNTLKKKVVGGIFSYSLRQVIVLLIGLSSNVLILRWIMPEDYGYFATVSIFLGIVQIIAEGGLSIYLIQRITDINDKVLSETATFQLFIYIIAHILTTIILIVFYKLGLDTKVILFLWVALFIVPVTILRSNSFAGIERNLAFEKVAVIEIVESIVYASFSVFLAFLGWGLWSLITALIMKCLIGWRLASFYYKWKFQICWPNFTVEFKKGIFFGINYHMPAIIGTIRIAANPIIVGGILGIGAIGIADRAVYIAGLPLFFLGAIQQRVLFPYFARIQTDKTQIKSSFERSYYLSAVIDKIFYLPMVIFLPQILNLLAPKWIEALPLIYVCLIGNIVFGAQSFSMYPVFNGIGKANIIANISIVTAIVTWIVTWPLIKYFGVIGYTYVGLLLWFGSAIPSLIILKKYIPGVTIWRPFIIPLLSFVISCMILWCFTNYYPHTTIMAMIMTSIFGIFLYLLIIFIMDGKYLWNLLHMILQTWRKGTLESI